MREKTIAERVVAWLVGSGWEVFPEVRLAYGCQRADIVAKRGLVLWVIETKTSLSFTVLAQAERWIGYANMVSVAVPASYQRSIGRKLAIRVARSSGVGIITVDEWPKQLERAGFISRPRQLSYLSSLLHDGLKRGEAGMDGGGYWTPFKETVTEVEKRVRENPGITMKELMNGLAHHYSSDRTAKACISKWAMQGIIDGVEVRKSNGTLRLYPKHKEPAQTEINI